MAVWLLPGDALRRRAGGLLLVLVVICLVTAPLLLHTLHVDLPARATPLAAPVPFLSVTLDGSGQAYLDNVPVTQAQLSLSLRAVAQRAPATELRLRVEHSLPYGKVLELMGLAHAAGLQHVAFLSPSPQALGH